MVDTPEILDAKALSEIAEQSGLAIAFVDENSREIAVSNNNSICKTLNPGREFSKACSVYCGAAFEKVKETGRTLKFECHAGLECTAVAKNDTESDLVVIVGRTFVDHANYKKAVERAMAGDWAKYDTSDFFANILMTSSSAILEESTRQIEARFGEKREEAEPPETTVDQTPVEQIPPDNRSESAGKSAKGIAEISRMVERFNREIGLKKDVEKPAISTAKATVQSVKEKVSVVDPGSFQKMGAVKRRTLDISAWRSFYGSFLNQDYRRACRSVLTFIANHFDRSSLVWLDKKENRLVSAASIGDIGERRLKLSVAADDKRLLSALRNETPIVLNERARSGDSAGSRPMYLYPIGVGNTVSSAIGIFENDDGDAYGKEISRICRSLAPQLEILRLRSEVTRGKSLANAVRKFSESIKHADGDDLWLILTQNAAELLRAERASLLLYNAKTRSLDIKAMIGAIRKPIPGNEIGSRVSRLVFEKNRPAVVADISKTSLPALGHGRKYKTRSFLSCPISIGGQTIGVMNFADKASGLPFDSNSADLFDAIAPQLAIAIDRATFKERAGTFEQLSVTDPLTGLLNRRYIEERLTEETKRSNRHGYPMSFLMLDIDQFKSFNDEFGHPAGDSALKLFGNVIRETLRGADIAARFGGEEFAILLPQTTSDEAWMIAERIRINVEETDFVHRKVTTSIGVASCSAKLCVSADLVSAADKALYEAKRGGRNRVMVFEQLDTSQAASQNSR